MAKLISYIKYVFGITNAKVYMTALLCILPLMTNAQFYPQDLSEDLYGLYVTIERTDNPTRAIQLADSVAQVCASKGDRNAEFLFRSLSIQYNQQLGNHETVRLLTHKLRQDAKSEGDIGDYWHFWSHHIEVMSLIDEGKTIDAFDLVSKIRDEAQTLHSDYGIYTTLFVIGEIYRKRDDIGMSGENYLKAYEYQQEHLPNDKPAVLCAYIAEYYRRKSGRTKEDMDKSKEFVERGLEYATDDVTRALLLTEKAMSLYSERDVAAFNKIYRECDSLYKIIGETPEFLQIKYRKHILDKDYTAAMSIVNRLPNEYERHIARYVTLKAKGDYENALQYYEKANHALNLIREQERRGDLSEISAKLNNYQLELANTTLEQERTDARNARSRAINTALTLICLCAIMLLIGVLLFNRRIKRANKKLEQSNNQLTEARNKAEQSERMKTMFIQNMSHEIRTPLNAIVGFANLLTYDDNDYSERELNEFRRLINENCDSLTKLVDNILTISDFESGKFIFEYKETYVNEMCNTAVETVRDYAKAGVDLYYTSEVDNLYKVNIDSQHVLQVLNSLLMNACKYTYKGEIELHASITDDRHLRLAVTDTGSGIPESKKDEIFQRFTKLDSFSQGTGLGLSIAKMITHKLNGKIYLDTGYVLGARFVLEVPI